MNGAGVSALKTSKDTVFISALRIHRERQGTRLSCDDRKTNANLGYPAGKDHSAYPLTFA
jgi:hypothetical protein